MSVVVLTFRHIQCLHLICAAVAWVLLSSETQAQPQIILDPDCLSDYLSLITMIKKTRLHKKAEISNRNIKNNLQFQQF